MNNRAKNLNFKNKIQEVMGSSQGASHSKGDDVTKVNIRTMGTFGVYSNFRLP